MRVLLIQPPPVNKALEYLTVEPIPLESIAAINQSCDYEILDMRFDRNPLEKHLKDFRPDIVGITGNTLDFYNVRDILDRVKAFNEEIFTVVGGHHASVRPSDFNCSSVDAIVIGMGEITFSELLDALQNNGSIDKVKGLGLPSENGLVFTETRPVPKNLDHFPIPRRDLTARYRKYYRAGVYGMGLISTAKGCPFRCKFCSMWKEMQGKYITKSPEKVLEDLKSIPQKLVRFVDGNTFGNIPRMEKLYQLVKESGIKKRYLMDVRADTVIKSGDLLKKWSEIGLEYMALGLESMKAEQLDYLNKRVSVESNKKAIQVLHDCNIKIGGLFIIDQGFTREDFRNTLSFVRQSGIELPFYHILTPLPGTDLYEEKKDELISTNYEEYDLNHTVLPTDMDKSQFFNCFSELWKDSYSLKYYIRERFRSLSSNLTNAGKKKKYYRLSFLAFLSTYAFVRNRAKYFCKMGSH